jgi:alpha-amylase
MQEVPLLAVTLVENHDTQPLQSLESPVDDWFKPLAYALILLRMQGYPCIFYPDYYGSNYSDYGGNGETQDIKMISHKYLIDRMLLARKHFAYGEQIDYFDDPNAVGWTRLGTELHPYGLAVLMSDGPQDQKWMNVGKPNKKFIDITHHCNEPVMTNNDGWGPFRCQGGSVSIWVAIDAIQEHLKQSI